MTCDDFVAELEQIFDKQLKPAQKPVYREKLRRFSGEQLLEILNAVLEEARTFPKVSEIYKSAQLLGFLQSPNESFKPHEWETTDCKMCAGEGRIATVWVMTSELKNGQPRLVYALQRMQPYSGVWPQLENGQFTTLYRCSCIAGDALSLSKAWPKWIPSKGGIRYA